MDELKQAIEAFLATVPAGTKESKALADFSAQEQHQALLENVTNSDLRNTFRDAWQARLGFTAKKPPEQPAAPAPEPAPAAADQPAAPATEPAPEAPPAGEASDAPEPEASEPEPASADAPPAKAKRTKKAG